MVEIIFQLYLKDFLAVLLSFLLSLIVYRLLLVFLQDFLGLEKWLKRKGIRPEVYNIKLSRALSIIIAVYVFLITAAGTAKTAILRGIIEKILKIYPEAITVVLSILFGMLFGEAVRKWILGMKMPFSKELAAFAESLLLLLFFSTGLEIAGVKIEMLMYTVKTLIWASCLAMSLAVGIGLGLALKDKFKEMI